MSAAGRHAVITGGGSGVGAAVATAMAKAGAKVTILGRREPPLQEVAASHPPDQLGGLRCDTSGFRGRGVQPGPPAAWAG